MITKNRRKAGLVIFVVGLLIFGFSLIIAPDNPLTRDLVGLISVFQISGIGVALLGLLTIVAPKDPMERRAEKMDQLEKRVAQLERERKNTP